MLQAVIDMNYGSIQIWCRPPPRSLFQTYLWIVHCPKINCKNILIIFGTEYFSFINFTRARQSMHLIELVNFKMDLLFYIGCLVESLFENTSQYFEYLIFSLDATALLCLFQLAIRRQLAVEVLFLFSSSAATVIRDITENVHTLKRR